MVRYFVLLAFIFSTMQAQDSISVVLPQEGVVSQNPMNVTVLVTHGIDEKVKEDTFALGKKQVPAHIIQKEPKPSEPQFVVSQYTLDLPKMDPGVYPLPAISVEINGKRIASSASTIQVREGIPDEVTPFLKMELLFSGTTPLYPGQRAWVGYRIEFNRSVDLTEEVLPFLTPKGFKLLGEKQIKDKQEGGVSVRQILQKIEADAPGKFTIPASKVSGYSYIEGTGGKKEYQKPLLTASDEGFFLEVEDFPDAGKPLSFSGSVGSFSISSAIVGTHQVSTGDPIKLKVTLKGNGEFETMQLPDLCCQPGFSGYFKESDLPPVVEMKEGEKSFVFELFPQTSFLHQVPSIAFSFFDPVKKAYGTVKSDPLPIEVNSSLPSLPKETPQETSKIQSNVEKAIPLPAIKMLDLPFIFWDGWQLLFILPFTAILAWLFALLNEWSRRVTSKDYFQKAIVEANREKALRYLEMALKMRLGSQAIENPLLARVEEERFGKEKSSDLKSLFQEAERLWEKN